MLSENKTFDNHSETYLVVFSVPVHLYGRSAAHTKQGSRNNGELSSIWDCRRFPASNRGTVGRVEDVGHMHYSLCTSHDSD